MAKVLLVEDDNNLREIYEARLQAEGYEISSAMDGEQALVVAKDFKPDLIISDVMMPKISGFEMLDILRNTAGLEHTRVIMLTALGQAEDKARADSLGADRYLVKSQVTLEDIIKAAHDILDGDSAPAAAAAPASEPVVAAEISVASEPVPVAEPTPEAAEPVAATTTEAPAEPAGASTEPASAAPSEPTTVPVNAGAPSDDSSASVPATVAANNTSSASDDKLLTDAAGALGGNDDTADQPNAVITPTVDSPAPAAEEEESGGSSKRVIQPIDNSQAKPSLAELLALEEVKEAGLPTDINPVSTAQTEASAESTDTIAITDTGAITASAPADPAEPAADKTPKKDDFNPHDISL